MLQPDLFYVAPDGSHQDDWIMEELLGADDVDEGEYASVVDDGEEPRTLGEKAGHPFRGNQYKLGNGSKRLLKTFGETKQTGQTGFVLPDGTRVKKDYTQMHAEAAHEAGTDMDTLFDEGVIRYIPQTGIEFTKIPTEAQAQLIADDFKFGRNSGMYLDIRNNRKGEPYDSTSEWIPKEKITADFIRNFAKAHLSQEPGVRAAAQAEVLRVLGDLPGHVFHGNQYTLPTTSLGPKGEAAREVVNAMQREVTRIFVGSLPDTLEEFTTTPGIEAFPKIISRQVASALLSHAERAEKRWPGETNVPGQYMEVKNMAGHFRKLANNLAGGDVETLYHVKHALLGK